MQDASSAAGGRPRAHHKVRRAGCKHGSIRRKLQTPRYQLSHHTSGTCTRISTHTEIRITNAMLCRGVQHVTRSLVVCCSHSLSLWHHLQRSNRDGSHCAPGPWQSRTSRSVKHTVSQPNSLRQMHVSTQRSFKSGAAVAPKETSQTAAKHHRRIQRVSVVQTWL